MRDRLIGLIPFLPPKRNREIAIEMIDIPRRATRPGANGRDVFGVIAEEPSTTVARSLWRSQTNPVILTLLFAVGTNVPPDTFDDRYEPPGMADVRTVRRTGLRRRVFSGLIAPLQIDPLCLRLYASARHSVNGAREFLFW